MPPVSVPLQDDTLLHLVGTEIRSEVSPSVSYRIARRVGEGGMAIAYLAMRVSPDGQCPVVIKVMRPWSVRKFGETAALVVKKEAVALGRLNERVPATPFVVRLLDVGAVPISPDESSRALSLPWIALEYIHGGAEGTTLTERVARCIDTTGSAFDTHRAAHAIECLCKGLAAVHEVGVVHRDLKPDNVLCCGFGDREIFKVADFGVARPVGVAGTFGGVGLGTPGYAAPEVIMSDAEAMGPWSDVFSLAAVIYFVITGEDYFQARSVADAILNIQNPVRRSLLDAKTLDPELRDHPVACRAIDQALARASAAMHELRPRDAMDLAGGILPWLRTDSRRLRPTQRRPRPVSIAPLPKQLPAWSWMVRQQPGADQVVRSVAWDGDGRCLAATNRGLVFWNGTAWQDAPTSRIPDPRGIRFVRRIAAGRWLIGCDPATVAIFTPDGVRDIVDLSSLSLRVHAFSGDLDDLGIAVATDADGLAVIHTLVGRRWLKALHIPELRYVSSVSRVADATWLVAGRGVDGFGYAGLCTPLEWEIHRLDTPPARAFLSCGGHPSRELGIVGGTDGAVLLRDGDRTWCEEVPAKPDLAAVVVDAAGGFYAGAGGRIWRREIDEDGRVEWLSVWEDASWDAPIVSLFADVGLVIGLTADGAIIEGRAIELETGTLIGTAS